MSERFVAVAFLGILSAALLWSCYDQQQRQKNAPTPPATPVKPAPEPLAPKPQERFEVYYFTQSTCGPCKTFERSTLGDSTVKAALQKDGVTVRTFLDDRDAFRKWSVSGTPTCRLVRISSGEPAPRGEPLVGNAGPARFLDWFNRCKE